MNRPAGNDDSGPDLLDALQDIKNELRKEFDKKLNELRLVGRRCFLIFEIVCLRLCVFTAAGAWRSF